MNTKQSILDSYEKLRSYCDSFFASVARAFPRDIACGKGCADCCELHSACALEAHVLSQGIVDRTILRRSLSKNHTPGRCVLLLGKSCAVYPARPIICRTHGLVISIDKGSTVASSCEQNFTGSAFALVPKSMALDAEAITDTLMRLNMAFCMTIWPYRACLETIYNGTGAVRHAAEEYFMMRIS